MGQINSIHHNTESNPQPLSSMISSQSEGGVDDGTPITHAQIDDEVATARLSTTMSSLSSSVGRNLRNLVRNKSSSTARGRVDSTASQIDSQSSRRRWRTSRRWSKAPEELSSPVQGSQEVFSAVPENSSEESEGVPMTPPSNAKGKEKEDVDQRPTDIETAFDPTGLDEGTSTNVSAWMGEEGSGAQNSSLTPNIRPDEGAMNIPSINEIVDREPPVVVQNGQTSAPAPPTHTTASDGQASGSQGRQFPPPGTLVVVQGVVHTADVFQAQEISRPSHAGVARPSSVPAPWNTPRRAFSVPRSYSLMSDTPAATGARNRLSALIPHSTIRPRPDSIVEDNNATPSSDLAVENETDGEPSPVTSDTLGSEDLSPASNEIDTSVPYESEALPPPALSPNSIDVLGTLLSVAAAATAASLLTGSSGPILSGLNPAANGNMPSASRLPTDLHRPTSPTPIPGLEGLRSLYPGLGLAGPPRAPTVLNGHGNGRARVRHAWVNLRERLGIRTSSNAASDSIQARHDRTPMDTRDLMLAEMTRAFNIGLGLRGGPDADHTPQTPGESSVENQEGAEPPVPPSNLQEHPEPAEDSFEQFLINLQADLRVALSFQESPAAQPPSYTPNLPSNEIPAQPSAEGAITHPARLPTTITDQGAEASTYPFALDPESAVDEDSGANPAMSGGSDTPQVRQNLPGISTTMGSRTEHRPGGGINWWRSYRFPSVTAPAPNAHGLPNTSNVASSPLTSTPPSDLFYRPPGSAPSSTPPSSSTTTSQDSSVPGASPTTTENAPNIFVPVIVVGLQSVNMDRRHDQAPSFGDEDTLAAEHNEDHSPGAADDLDFDDSPGNGGQPGAPRGRAWHSRAADALRNLRPGRRASQIPHTGPGSRTFLIYVIGGYYPPDHSLITGIDGLDSFEALWELAELLGQVKPQTVSQEEIEKSGLEIIKSTVLEQYEKEGKVASNCIERCLICLDDYEHEADLRLLKCRHAFHKNCVDQWLQTGKNNCPACRTEGVSTSDRSEPHTSATSII